MKETKELMDSALRCIANGNPNIGMAYATLIVACELQNLREEMRNYFGTTENQGLFRNPITKPLTKEELEKMEKELREELAQMTDER